MKTISLFFLMLTLWLTASCSHTAATGATGEGASGVSDIAADKSVCAEVAKRYIQNIMAGDLKAADKDRSRFIRNGHTSDELIPMMKGFGALDHSEILSVDVRQMPDARRSTVEGLIYFKSGQRQHFRAEEQQGGPGQWVIIEFTYQN